MGRLKAGPESELCNRYLDRARKSGRALGFRAFGVTEIPEARAARPAERIAAEDAALAALLPAAGRGICLDPLGELLDSQSFAGLLSNAAESRVAQLTFVIGGPDGLGTGVLAKAALRISFGRVTWPHGIVRVLLAEQLYRAMTILSGHPYHRA